MKKENQELKEVNQELEEEIQEHKERNLGLELELQEKQVTPVQKHSNHWQGTSPHSTPKKEVWNLRMTQAMHHTSNASHSKNGQVFKSTTTGSTLFSQEDMREIPHNTPEEVREKYKSWNENVNS